MIYCELIHIHHGRWPHPHCGWILCCCAQCKHTSAWPLVSCPQFTSICWREACFVLLIYSTRFGSPWAGSGPHLYCISHLPVPSPPPGTTSTPVHSEDAFTSAAWDGSSWWCRATCDRVGPNAAGRSCCGGTAVQQAVISKAHPSEESGLRTLPRRNLPLRSSFNFQVSDRLSFKNLATSQLASSPAIQFQARDRLTFKFVIASLSVSPRFRHFGPLALCRVGSWLRVDHFVKSDWCQQAIFTKS